MILSNSSAWLLVNARKLHKFKQVCMNPDLTRAERVAQLESRQELAQKNSVGEKGIYICR